MATDDDLKNLVTEITNLRSDRSWEKLTEVILRLESAGSGAHIQQLVKFYKAEQELELFIDGFAIFPTPTPNNNDKLRPIKKSLHAVFDTPTDHQHQWLMMDAQLLLAKIYYLCADYDNALSAIGNAAIDTIGDAPKCVRTLRLIAEARALRGLATERQAASLLKETGYSAQGSTTDTSRPKRSAAKRARWPSVDSESDYSPGPRGRSHNRSGGRPRGSQKSRPHRTPNASAAREQRWRSRDVSVASTISVDEIVAIECLEDSMRNCDNLADFEPEASDDEVHLCDLGMSDESDVDDSDKSFVPSDFGSQSQPVLELSQGLGDLGIATASSCPGNCNEDNNPSVASNSHARTEPQPVTPPKPTCSMTKIGDLASNGSLIRQTQPVAEIDNGPTAILTQPSTLLEALHSFHCHCPGGCLLSNLDMTGTAGVPKLCGGLNLHCKACGASQKIPNVGDRSVIERLVIQCAFSGIDFGQLAPLLMALKLNPVSKQTYHRKRSKMLVAAEAAAQVVMRKNVERCKEAAQQLGLRKGRGGCYRIPVSVDGSWKTPGFRSQHGVVFVICQLTGLVIDYAVRSKTCAHCTAGATEASHQCDCNHFGNSGAMEREGAMVCWERSISQNSLIYEFYVGDADSKGFSAVMNMYEGAPLVKKIHCRNHHFKRFVSNIESKRKYYRAQCVGQKVPSLPISNYEDSDKKSDGPKAQGMGVLLNKHMAQFTKCLLLAMAAAYIPPKFDIDSEEVARAAKAMHGNIVVAVMHMCSDHSRCPEGPGTWCSTRRCQAGVPGAKGRNYWPTEYRDFILDALRQVINPSVLTTVVFGMTQNANESANSLIWLTAQKRKNHGAKLVRTAAALAAIRFCEGTGGYNRVFYELKLSLPRRLSEWFDEVDARRVKESIDRRDRIDQLRKQSRAALAKDVAAQLADPSYKAGCGD